MDARAAALAFRLTEPPPGFADDPYPMFAALREHAPVHEIAPGTLLLTRHAEVDAVYRSADVSSDKKREFAPKLGLGTPLYEHHTTSVVFNDPPLHTRVRRLMMGAVNQRAITRMEPGLVALVDGLLDRMAGLSAPCLIEDFAAARSRWT
jgi:cytochrome P450